MLRSKERENRANAFIRAYLASGSARKAAKSIGLHESAGSKVLRWPETERALGRCLLSTGIPALGQLLRLAGALTSAK